MNVWQTENTDFLYHYGVKGQKWGIRRYQNPDGTLTELGKKRLYKSIKTNANASESLRNRKGGLVGAAVNTVRVNRARSRIQELTSGHAYKAKEDAADKARHIEEHATDKEWRASQSQKRSMDSKNIRRYMEQELKSKYSQTMAQMRSELDAESSQNKRKEQEIANELLGKYANKKVNKRGAVASDYLSPYVRR